MIIWRLMTSCPCLPQRRSALRFPSLMAKRFESNTRSTPPNPSNACSCFPLPSGPSNRHLALLHSLRSLNNCANIRFINYFNFWWPLIMIPLLILIFVLHLSVSAILPLPLAFYGSYFSYQTLPPPVSSLNKIVPLLVRYSCYVYICNIIQTFGSIHGGPWTFHIILGLLLSSVLCMAFGVYECQQFEFYQVWLLGGQA